MTKPYENKRELVDDLLMLYGQATGAALAGQAISSAGVIEQLGEIIARAHVCPAGHAEHVARARELEAAKPMERPDLRRGGLRAVK